MKRTHVTWVGRLAGIGVLATWVWSGAGVAPCRAQDTAGAAASAGMAQSVDLDYYELKEGVINWGLVIRGQTKAFPKEPNVGVRKVCRGFMQFGGATNSAIGFLWDYTQGRLYLDLNGNQDLTDDPAGVCVGPATRYSNYYHTFTNLQLTLQTPAGRYPLRVDLSLYNPYGNQPGGTVACRSFWAGKVSLQGRDWQIGLVAGDPGRLGSSGQGYLLLRPWAARDTPFNVQDGSLDAFSFRPDLFFGQRAYHVTGAFVTEDGRAKYRLNLSERPAELGELRLTGQFIGRVILTGQQSREGKPAYVAVLDAPEPVVRIPAGRYDRCQVLLQAGGKTAHPDPARGGEHQTLTVEPDGTKVTTLKAGGPLTNTVTLNRRGRFLSLSYQLVGAEGAIYQIPGQGRTQPPRFSIQRQGKVIETGKFEFG